MEKIEILKMIFLLVIMIFPVIAMSITLKKMINREPNKKKLRST